MKIGFIGFGEAAYNLAIGLKGEGLEGIRACDAMQDHPERGQFVRARAAEAGVEAPVRKKASRPPDFPS